MANEEIRLANIEKVLRVAIDLFIENGIENTTREMLARSSGLSRRSIERYFPTKQDYVVQAAVWFANSLAENFKSAKMLKENSHSADEILKIFFEELKQTLLAEPRIFICFAEAKGFIYRNCEKRSDDYKRLLQAIGWRSTLQKIFEKGEMDGTLKCQYNPEKTAHYLANTIVSYFSNLVLLFDQQPEIMEQCASVYIMDMWNMYCDSQLPPDLIH